MLRQYLALLPIILATLTHIASAKDELIGPPPQEHKAELDGEVGLNFSTGNSPNQEIKLAGEYDQEDELRRYAHKFSFYQERASTNNEPMTLTEEKAHWKSRGEWYFVDQPGYLFSKLKLEYDRFSYLQKSATLASGFGYSVVRSKPLRFDVEAGVGYQYAHRLEQGTTQSSVTVLAEIFKWQIDHEWQVRQDASTYRTRYENNLELNAEVRRRLNENIAIKLGLEWQHLSPVPEGVHKDDVTTMLSLIYSM